MKEIYIHHHLGLGDHIDMNGFIRFFLLTNGFNKINLFVKSSYYDMIQYMYSDEDRINLIPIDPKIDEDLQVFAYMRKINNGKLLRVGFENYPFGKEIEENKNCWEYFYEQLNVPYDVKVNFFYVERNVEEEERLYKKLNPSNEPYIFLHDDSDRGFSINHEYISNKNLKIIKNDKSENIFYFLKILENAEEIHCMESSFKSLIEIYAKTEKLFFHDFRNHPLGTKTNKKWRIVKYD